MDNQGPTDGALARIVVAVAIMLCLAAGAGSLFLPSSYRCVSIGAPEGVPCDPGRIEFRGQGPWVSVVENRNFPLRTALFAIAIASAAIAASPGWLVGVIGRKTGAEPVGSRQVASER